MKIFEFHLSLAQFMEIVDGFFLADFELRNLTTSVIVNMNAIGVDQLDIAFDMTDY